MDFLKKLKAVFAFPAALALPQTPLEQMRPFLQANGTYVFGLTIETDGSFLLVRSDDLKGFRLGLECARGDHSGLASARAIAVTVESAVKLNTGKENTVLFRRRNTDAYVSGSDENAFLPAGNAFEIVLVPAGCAWAPPAPPVPGAGGKCPFPHR